LNEDIRGRDIESNRKRLQWKNVKREGSEGNKQKIQEKNSTDRNEVLSTKIGIKWKKKKVMKDFLDGH